jgi:biopolymer transport protein ExbB/TolQ
MKDAAESLQSSAISQIEWLNLIAVAPMVGLFGTVVGMIGLFNHVRQRSAAAFGLGSVAAR